MAQRHDENYNEQPMTRMGRIQQPSRRYRRLRHPSFTAAIWTANNPLLQRGEIGTEIDTGKLKVGDGVTYWNDLGYVAASTIPFADITGDPYDNAALKDALDAKQDVLTAGTGISIDSDNVISNSGVRSVATGTTNGTISVNTGGASAEVAVYGLGSAAYTSSSDYATAAQGAKADNAANKDLSNLTSTGANIGNWSSNVSNCITEIPQDIKLELNNGTLTLKAGSKIYVPNGAGVFDEITVTSDKTFSYNYDAKQYFVFYSPGGNIDIRDSTLIFSGSTEPPLLNNTFWYDTTNNVIKKYHNSQWNSGYSFPVGLITTSTSGIVSIDQVFNGFGYIGGTAVALPGVKVLIPAGRNADGTLKSVARTTNSVTTRNINPVYTGYFDFTINTGGAIGGLVPINYKYDEQANYFYAPSGDILSLTVIAQTHITAGKIDSFEPKIVFRAVDYNDTDFIAHQATPSSKYVDLTLPSTGGYLTMPADGFLTVGKTTGGTTEYLTLLNTANNIAFVAYPNNSGYTARVYIPVSKDDIIQVNYSVSGATQYCRFVYANGAK